MAPICIVYFTLPSPIVIVVPSSSRRRRNRVLHGMKPYGLVVRLKPLQNYHCKSWLWELMNDAHSIIYTSINAKPLPIEYQQIDSLTRSSQRTIRTDTRFEWMRSPGSPRTIDREPTLGICCNFPLHINRKRNVSCVRLEQYICLVLFAFCFCSASPSTFDRFLYSSSQQKNIILDSWQKNLNAGKYDSFRLDVINGIYLGIVGIVISHSLLLVLFLSIFVTETLLHRRSSIARPRTS